MSRRSCAPQSLSLLPPDVCLQAGSDVVARLLPVSRDIPGDWFETGPHPHPHPHPVPSGPIEVIGPLEASTTYPISYTGGTQPLHPLHFNCDPGAQRQKTIIDTMSWTIPPPDNERVGDEASWIFATVFASMERVRATLVCSPYAPGMSQLALPFAEPLEPPTRHGAAQEFDAHKMSKDDDQSSEENKVEGLTSATDSARRMPPVAARSARTAFDAAQSSIGAWPAALTCRLPSLTVLSRRLNFAVGSGQGCSRSAGLVGTAQR